MIIICGLLIIMVSFLLTYLFFLKKEVKNIKKQLDEYNKFKNRKKIDIALFDSDIENLACSINENIDIFTKLQLEQSKNEEALKDTIAKISHDLRTPLTSILGYIQIMKKDKTLQPRFQNYLVKSENRAKDLQNLLNDFFTLSLIESKEYKIELENINLKSIIIETLTSFYDEFENNNISIEVSIEDYEYSVIGEYGSIKRVAGNLFSNLIKHSKGDVLIKLEEVNDFVELSLVGDSLGLTEDDVDHMFNKFYKGDKSRSKNSTGLGLAIVSGLMDRMGGKAFAKLEENKLIIKCSWLKEKTMDTIR